MLTHIIHTFNVGCIWGVLISKCVKYETNKKSFLLSIA